jgi:hypothetical protein
MPVSRTSSNPAPPSSTPSLPARPDTYLESIKKIGYISPRQNQCRIAVGLILQVGCSFQKVEDVGEGDAWRVAFQLRAQLLDGVVAQQQGRGLRGSGTNCVISLLLGRQLLSLVALYMLQRRLALLLRARGRLALVLVLSHFHAYW